MSTTISVGPQVPRRGNAVSRFMGRAVLWLLGWRLAGSIPDEPKMVMIGAPHTTNMDGVIALATLTALNIQASTMIKDTAFHGLLGVLLRWLGAIPINRRSPKGVVEQSIDAFNQDKFILLIAPEGTRHATEHWKRGYYHVAAGASVPIIPAACDYKGKVITFGPPLRPSGTYETDFRQLLDFYTEFGVPGHPERLSKSLCEHRGQAWRPAQRGK